MFILSESKESIGTITINNPTKRNALGRELIEELIAALEDFRKASARAIVIRAPRVVLQAVLAPSCMWQGSTIAYCSPPVPELLNKSNAHIYFKCQEEGYYRFP